MTDIHLSIEKEEPRMSTTRLFRAMGTEAYIEIVHTAIDKERAEKSLSETIRLCFDTIPVFNRFDPESELSLLNKNLGTYRVASPDMLTLARRAIDYFEESDGLYDPRILTVLQDVGYSEDFSPKNILPTPPKKTFQIPKNSLSDTLKILGKKVRFDVPMDLSGIAKGYILDKMARYLAKDGWDNFLLDAGGDMILRGLNKEMSPWKIDIENVSEKELFLELSEKSVATSGITRRQWIKGKERFHHLIHPKRPYDFSFDILSVTTLSNSAEHADFLAKTLFFMGEKEGFSFAEKHSIPAVFVSNKVVDSWHMTSEVKKYLSKDIIHHQ